MDESDQGDDRTRFAERSRRVFVLGAGVVGLGLATGTAVPASSSDHGDSGPETENEGSELRDEEATADDGEPTPIDSPTTIEDPGEYVLVADIVPDSLEDGHGIAVDLGETDDGSVTIYGNGHTIDLSRTDGGDCIVSNPRFHGTEGTGPGWGVHVENVTLTGGNRGIVSNYDTGGQFTDITAIGNREGFSFHLDHGTLTNCVLTENVRGVHLSGSQIHGGSDVRFEHCTIRANEKEGVSVGLGNVHVASSRIVRNGTGVYVGVPDAHATVVDSHICGNDEYGVHADSGTDEETGEGDLPGGATARNNYWGAANGPSSYGDPEEPYEDPETGEPADGDGDAIPEGLEPGVSNVRFDPFRESTLDDVGADS